MKISRWKRYDAKSGLWIASNKRIYTYWFKFLQHAENDPSRKVDWTAYEGWGGSDVILHTKFDAWWKQRWKTLFGYKQNVSIPLFGLSTTKPQPDGVRYSLLVYELKDRPLLDGDDLTGKENEGDGKKGDNWEIAKKIAGEEQPKRKAKAKKDPSYKPEDWFFDAVGVGWGFNIARKGIEKRLRKTDPKEFSKQKRNLQSRVGRYMRAAENHLDNVCEGRFP